MASRPWCPEGESGESAQFRSVRTPAVSHTTGDGIYVPLGWLGDVFVTLSPDSPLGRRGREGIVLSGEPWANLGHFNYKKVRKTRRGKFVMCISAPKTPSRKRLARARRNQPHDVREVGPRIQASARGTISS